MFSWRNKKNIIICISIPLIDLNKWTSTCKRAKLRVNIFSTSRLLIDDQLVLQNRWSTMKFWPIPNTTLDLGLRFVQYVLSLSSRYYKPFFLTKKNVIFLISPQNNVDLYQSSLLLIKQSFRHNTGVKLIRSNFRTTIGVRRLRANKVHLFVQHG